MGCRRGANGGPGACKGSGRRTRRGEGGSAVQWEGKIETLTCVGAKGTVEDVSINSTFAIAKCLNRKLRTFQFEKAMPIPPPPQAPYWVRLDLDWAEFAPVAPK